MHGLLIKSGQGTSQILREVVKIVWLVYRLLCTNMYWNIYSYLICYIGSKSLLYGGEGEGSHCAEDSTKDITEEITKDYI